MKNVWKVAETIPVQEKKELAKFSPLMQQLLYNKGLKTAELAENFLEAKYEEGLHSPFLFLEMEKAVGRVWQAIEKKQKICIYGDYDADAVTACGVLLKTFKYLEANAEYYIPDRFSEGYGVNLEALEKIKNRGVELIITVDCGTNSHDAVEFCKLNNIDLIITDHHEIVGKIPKPFALINPKNSEDQYPYHEITGVGVAFKLACGILAKKDLVALRLANARSGQPSVYTDGWEKWLLDLVAIGTVADCHSLMGENRILVKYGLKVLAKSKWPGLVAICATAGLDFSQKLPDTYTLGFVVAPRLNAAGRLEHASVALEAVLETDSVSALQKAQALEQINTRRQSITQNIVSEAKEMAEQIKDRKVLVLMKEGWPKGVVGLVAGKLAEEYNKPVIVLALEGDIATGSARTAGDYSILEGIKYAAEFVARFGGHKQAAGLSLKPENFEKFYEKLLEHAEKEILNNETEKVLHLDAELKEEDLTLETYKQLLNLEPFGVDNFKPKFLLVDAKVVFMRLVGKTQNHLQIRLVKGKKEIECIGFNLAYFTSLFKVGNKVSVACELIADEFNGVQKVKLRVVDLKPSVTI